MVKEKHYWKCLEDLHQDKDYLEENANEFSESAPSRRDFLKLMGFTVSTASLVACSRSPVHKALPFLNKPEELMPGVANWYATTCRGCSAGCSLLVKSRDGRPIKVEGNPKSPLTQGGVCAVGQATLLSLYDESRIRGPQWNGQGLPWQRFDEKIREALTGISEKGGKIVLLTGTLLSPSTRKLVQEFSEPYPSFEHIQYDPISSDAIRLAGERSFGKGVIPTYRFEKAQVILGLNVDFLGAWISPVEYSGRYIQNRKLQKPTLLSSHIQLESDISLTGSNADRRIPLNAHEEGAILLALLNQIHQLAGGSDLGSHPETTVSAQDLKEIAQQLWNHRGKSLVVSGSNEVSNQLAVNAINSLLGNIGKTVDLDNHSLQRQGRDDSYRRLVDQMNGGHVGALLIEGVNPAYDNPLASEFKKGLKKVSLSVSFNDYLDETTSLCKAVSPGLNFLEAWNDAQPKTNLYHLQQPLIAPLFDNRSFQDSLLKWLGVSKDFYTYLQDYWSKQLFSRQDRHLNPKAFWNHSLHDGVLVLPEETPKNYPLMQPVALFAKILKESLTKGKVGFALRLYESVGMREGQHANNPWNQELPDPVTKVTWDNYVKMAPSAARRLEIQQEELVRVQYKGQTITLPVHLQPGLHPETLSIALGYGRNKAGKVGNGVGQDFYPWVATDGETFRYTGIPVTLEKTGNRAKLATTQTHGRMEGRPIVKEATLKEWLKDPRAGNHEHVKLVSLWPPWKTGPDNWGMAMDLNACTGCSACVISCQVENNVPVVGKEEVWRRREMHWLRLDRYYTGSDEKPEVVHQPIMCQHCADAPCETVCPVLATVHSSDGLNQQSYNRCVGTRYCANNCPYKVRRFNWFAYSDNPKFDYYLNNNLGKMVLNPDVVVRSRGVMEKCSMCIQRIQEGRLRAKQEGRKLKDGEIKMACEQSCPTQAIVFGNLNDPDSRIAKLVKNERHYGLLEELGIRPNVGYLTKVRNKG